VKSLHATFDGVSNSFNRIQMFGGRETREVSIILRPEWDPEYDDETNLELFGSGHADWKNDPKIQKAWRKFAANESGAYTGTRPWWDSALELDVIWNTATKTLLRKKKLLPMIYRDAEGGTMGRHQGVFLEFWDPTGNGQWLAADGSSFRLLDDEIGVVFVGVYPPTQLYKMVLGDHAIEDIALRVTASVESDERIEFNRSRVFQSLLDDPKEEVLLLDSQYQLKTIFVADPATLDGNQIGGPAIVPDIAEDPDWPDPWEIDSSAAMQSKGADLLEKFNSNTFSGTVTLDGLDWTMADKLARPVWGIDIRKFEFRMTSPVTNARYPTIAGIEMDIQSQETRIRLETLKDMGSFAGSSRSRGRAGSSRSRGRGGAAAGSVGGFF